jgi:hypothetical protein
MFRRKIGAQWDKLLIDLKKTHDSVGREMFIGKPEGRRPVGKQA